MKNQPSLRTTVESVRPCSRSEVFLIVWKKSYGLSRHSFFARGEFRKR
jgi:hypothetical protein